MKADEPLDQNVFEISGNDKILRWDVDSTNALIIVILLLAFAPVFTGHYLVNREFYGHLITESSFWTQLKITPPEADPGGRVLGVAITQAVMWFVSSIDAAAFIRFILVLAAAGFALMLARDLRRHAKLPPLVAASVAIAAVTLPGMQVTVSNISQVQNLIALYPAYLAGRHAVGEERIKLFEWLIITLLILIALACSPIASMAFCLPPLIWTWSREGLPARSLIWRSFRTGLCFAGAAALYFILTKTEGQLAFSIGINSSTLEYANIILTVSAALWDTTSARPAEFFLAAIILGGAAARIVHFWRQGIRGAAIVSVMLAIAWAGIACLPRIAIFNYPVMAYRHTLVLSIALMLLGGIAFWELVRRLPFPVVVTAYCFLALFGAVICQRTLTTHLVTPAEAELNFAKARLRSANPDTLRHIHVVLADNKRQTLPGYFEEYSGLQSTMGAPSDGQYAWLVVLTALYELMKEDPRYAKVLPDWDWRQANTRVTVSDSTAWYLDLAHQLLPTPSLVIDFSALNVLGGPDYTVVDQRTGMTTASDLPEPILGRPLSSGEYPGFPTANAFDGDYLVSRWASETNGASAYIGMDLGSPVSG